MWDCSGVVAHVVAPEEVEPLVDEEVEAGEGRDALVESTSQADTAITRLLAHLVRRRGKPATVHATLAEALVALGHDRLPASLERLTAGGDL